jgi:hypothetical protein
VGARQKPNSSSKAEQAFGSWIETPSSRPLPRKAQRVIAPSGVPGVLPSNKALLTLYGSEPV